jgi:predicted component of type VI protein secretion system
VDVIDSIVHNLRAILNSDRGISASSPELGLSLHGALTEWESNRPAVLASITDLIERFEPRLINVDVQDMGHAGPHRFSVLICATLRDDGRSFRARTDMAASGAADVQQVLTEI